MFLKAMNKRVKGAALKRAYFLLSIQYKSLATQPPVTKLKYVVVWYTYTLCDRDTCTGVAKGWQMGMGTL